MLKSRLGDLEMPVRSLESDEVSSVSDTSKNHENHVVPKTMKTRLKHAFAKKNPKVTNISPSNPPTDMKSFFDDIEAVRSSIEQVKDAANKISELRGNARSSVSESSEAEFTNEVQKLAEKTNKTIKSTIELLTQLKECTMNEPEAGNNDHTMESVVKIRCNVIAACSRKLRDEVALYRRAQEAFHGEIQRKIKRQLKIIDPAVSDETVSAIVSSGESSHVVMKEQILQEKAVNQKIKDSCLQVHSKCQDILMLEKSIQQIHQLFLDMAVLTELQGSTLDQLNIHVHEATRYTEDANKHLEEACHSQKRIRNKQCRLALIALVVVVVVVIIVF